MGGSTEKLIPCAQDPEIGQLLRFIANLLLAKTLVGQRGVRLGP